MSVKDKVIFSLLVLLIAGAGYFQYLSGQLQDRMAVLNDQDKAHVDVVNKEFREELRKLNLQFIGRGKHVRKAQKDIIANTDLILAVQDSLVTKIDDVDYELKELTRDTERQFIDLGRDLSDLQDSFDSERRRATRRFSDVDQRLTTIENDLKKINETLTKEEKGKK